MRESAKAATFCALVVSLVILPAAALAQSAIGGVVTDSTSGVLPGVTVEAASPALIEGSRLAVTDGQGRYLISQLRPGTYTVTFTIPGFATVVRDGLVVPADFTATVSVQLRVGAVEENITVSGTSPVVDIQQTTRSQVLDQQTVDALPIGNTMGAQGSLVPGVKTTRLEIGSRMSMQGTYMSVYGAGTKENSLTIDGISIESADCDGTCFGYYNDRAFSETTYSTATGLAENPAGGVRVNLIPQEGSNAFHGTTYFMTGRPSWQANNLTPRLQSLGLTSVGEYSQDYDVNFSGGGAVVPSRLWVFSAYRNWVVNEIVPDSFYTLPDGTPDYNRPGIDDNRIQSAMAHVTWQANPQNKISIHFDRTFKERFHDHSAGIDIETASVHRVYPQSAIGQLKWNWTPTSRLLVEAAYGTRPISRTHKYQDGIEKTPFTPEWYAQASRVDRVLGTRTAASAGIVGSYSRRTLYQLKFSYVTGSHAFKMGWESDWGPVTNSLVKNADLDQEYRNGVPDTVLVANTPVWNVHQTDGDNSLFVQDSWTRKRLNINGGLRFEWLNASVPATEVPAGRFVGFRSFPEQANLPDWFDMSPRLGLVYDVFGTGRTALKFSLNKYTSHLMSGFAAAYAPTALVTQRVPWTDLNGDDVAQGELGCAYLSAGCEIDLSRLPTNFGERALSRPDPDIQRPWSLLSTLEVDHELLPGFSLSAAWIRRSNYDLFQSTNLLRSLADYTPVSIVNPLNGLPITVYNLNSKDLLAQVDILDTNAASNLPAGHPYKDLGRSEIYTAYEVNFNSRFPGGARLFGGLTMERTNSVACNSLDDPNTFRFCNQSGGPDAESGVDLHIPFRPMLKLSGTYPLPYGVNVSGSLQSFPGDADPVNWVVSPSTKYPTADVMALAGAPDCVGCEALAGQTVLPQLKQSSVTLQLAAPGERYLERQNLVSISVNRKLTVGRLGIEPQLDIFNLLNSDTVEQRVTTLGANYGLPRRVFWGRYAELSAKVTW